MFTKDEVDWWEHFMENQNVVLIKISRPNMWIFNTLNKLMINEQVLVEERHRTFTMQEQAKVSKVKEAIGQRWHPMFVCWCLALYSKSLPEKFMASVWSCDHG